MTKLGSVIEVTYAVMDLRARMVAELTKHGAENAEDAVEDWIWWCPNVRDMGEWLDAGVKSADDARAYEEMGVEPSEVK
jgi:hypothetical protein